MQAITIGLLTYSFTFWIASFQAEFGTSISTILLAASLSHVALAGIAPFAGRLLDSSAIQPFAIGGIVVFGVGYFLIAVSGAAWQIILLYSTLLPLGAAFAGPLSAQVATVRWFASKRGMALGITTLGSSIGGFVFPPIVTVFVASLGWRVSHVVLGVLMIAIMVPLIWVFMREPDTDDIESGDTPSPDEIKFPEWTIPQLLRSKTLWIIVFSFVPMLSVYLSYKYNLAPITAASGITPQQASFIMAVHAGSLICAKLFFGYMADRVEHRILIWMAAAFLLCSLLLPQVSTTYLMLLLSFGMLGLAGGGFLPLMGVIAASRFGPGNIGRVIGLTGPLNMVGSFGPSVFAFLYISFGSYNSVFQIMMVMVVPTIIAAYFLSAAVPEKPSANGKVVQVDE